MDMNGANPPLLMVHGWGGSHQETWQKSGVEQLINDAGTTVIGVDLLGHGTSAKPHDPTEYADLSARRSEMQLVRERQVSTQSVFLLVQLRCSMQRCTIQNIFGV